MDQLLNPDFGVLALTVVNFLLLVWLLHKLAWKGLIAALDRREKQIADNQAAAAQARQEAEQLKQALDEKLQHISAEAAQKIQEAVAIGNTQKEQLLAQTQEQAERLLAQAKEQIEAEKEKALKEARSQIAHTALLAAQRLTQQQLNASSSEQLVEQVLNDISSRA